MNWNDLNQPDCPLWMVLRPEIRWIPSDTDGVCLWGKEPNIDPTKTYRYQSNTTVSFFPQYLMPIENLPVGPAIIERPHKWKVPDKDTPIDAKCLTLTNGRWSRQHWAGKSASGKLQYWAGGGTRWTTSTKFECGVIFLADPDDPGRVPPDDFYPRE